MNCWKPLRVRPEYRTPHDARPAWLRRLKRVALQRRIASMTDPVGRMHLQMIGWFL